METETQKNTSTQTETVSTDSRSRATKVLAIIGFIGILLIVAWLSIMLVSSLPNAFGSLASTLQSLQSPSADRFNTIPAESTIAHNQSTSITWDQVNNRGSYAILFTCIDGVSVEVRTSSNGIQAIDCEVFYNLGNTNEVGVTVRSDASRFVDIPYTIAFIPDNNPDRRIETTSRISVINQTISLADNGEDTAPDAPSVPPITDEEDSTTPDETTTPDDTTDTEPVVTPTPTPTPPVVYREEYIYAVPVSDPNGFTDLTVQYLGIGELSSAQAFQPRATIRPSTTGALRFTVKNTGTRTSETWTYTATLPNGTEYTSPTQAALKPNERATITLGFTAPDTRGSYPIKVEVATSRDRDRSNNSFTWSTNIQ